MLSTAQIKYVKSLHQKKFRDLHNVFLVEGEKIVGELTSSSLKVEAIFAKQSWIDANQLLFDASIPNYTATNKDMERITNLKTPSAVVAVVRKPPLDDAIEISSDKIILALDTIQDPGNLGTIIRTADWFGIKQVVCSMETAEIYNPKVIQATMGSFARVKTSYLSLSEFISKKSGETPIIGATLQGQSLKDCKPPKGGIIVIGNESKGISKEILPLLTKEIQIPKATFSESAESLNASVAAGIIMAWVSDVI